MPSKKEDKENLIHDELRYVTICSGLHRNPHKTKIFLFSLVLCFFLLFGLISTAFWYINYKASHQPLHIYLLTREDESLVAKIISPVEAKKLRNRKEVFSTSVHIFGMTTQNYACSVVPPLEKFDCYPDSPVTETQCVSRGCCYQQTPSASVTQGSSFPPLNVPYCFYPSDYIGYYVQMVLKTREGLIADLERKIPSGFPRDIAKLKLVVSNIDENILRVKITDAGSERFVPPIAQNVIPKSTASQNYVVALTPLEGVLTVTRKSTNAVLFSVNLHQLVYSDQFLQLSTKLSTPYLYGLGEHYEPFLKDVNWTRRSLFNRDNWPRNGVNLYGTHALYVAIEKDTKSHGVYFLNSNAIDIILQPTPALTYRTIGGIFDFFIMLGPSPPEVIQQYTSIIGRSFMPPYWSLGFHLCKYGYGSLNNTKAAWARTRNAGIPFDTQWNDIDYMKTYNDFTYDDVAFAGLPEFVNELHDLHMHYVPIIDTGVSNTEPAGSYPPYDDGLKADLFIKNSTGDIFIGKVWNPITTVFPDFSHPATEEYWTKQFQALYDEIKYDGAWIDMNEPANFYDGMVDGCPDTSLDNPPYVPNGNEPLRTHTLCMSAKHYNTTHYNEHSLHGYREAIATNKALRNVTGKRPFIISRSSFAGQGVYSGHWSGDIGSSWEDMRYSNIDLLNFNMFGIPMMGSDICGFRDDTTVELCARWQAVGAFYPFSRNHNDLNQKDQDPASLGSDVLSATRNTLLTRYTLLPYLYTLFYKSHVYGTLVVTSLVFEFPSDPMTYAIEEQFMWGSALMIMPALYQGVNETKVYFPKALWYDYYTGELLNASGQQVILPAPLDSINLAVRGGYVIPQQYPNLTTAESRLNKFTLLAMLDQQKTAIGELYWDDGESLDTYENGTYNLIKFTIQDSVFISQVEQSGYNTTMNLDKIKICTLTTKPTTVTVNGKAVFIEFDNYKCLTVTAGISLLDKFIVKWM